MQNKWKLLWLKALLIVVTFKSIIDISFTVPLHLGHGVYIKSCSYIKVIKNNIKCSRSLNSRD